MCEGWIHGPGGQLNGVRPRPLLTSTAKLLTPHNSQAAASLFMSGLKHMSCFYVLCCQFNSEFEAAQSGEAHVESVKVAYVYWAGTKSQKRKKSKIQREHLLDNMCTANPHNTIRGKKNAESSPDDVRCGTYGCFWGEKSDVHMFFLPRCEVFLFFFFLYCDGISQIITRGRYLLLT